MQEHIQTNQITQEAISRFLKKIKYQPPPDSLSPVFGIVSQVFALAGQKYLLYLIKLRRHWLEQNDEFLARHAYPQNFSIVREMTVTPHYLKTLEAETSLSPTILEQLRTIENLSFTKNRFFKQLHQHLKQPLTEREQQLLLNYAVFTIKETVLHLVVYDGAFTQAIQFEMSNYLKQINQLLGAIQVDRIECHVGDLGQKRQDQIWVSKLAHAWDSLIDPSFKGTCMPAFIQRFNYYEATLIVYVTNQTVQAQLRAPHQAQTLLTHICQNFPELQLVIQKINYIVQQGMNSEKIRMASTLTGESAYDPLSSYDRLKQLIQQYADSPSHQQDTPSSSEKKQASLSSTHLQAVEQIIQRMKEKTINHNLS